MKHLKSALFLISSLLIVGCNNTPKPSNEAPKSEAISEDIPGGNPNSELVSSQIPPATSKEDSKTPASSATPSSDAPTSSSRVDTKPTGSVLVHMSTMVPGGNEQGYMIPIHYDFNCFDASAKVFSDDIKMMSFGAALSTESYGSMNNFINQLKFSTYSEIKLFDPKEDTIGYSISMRRFDDYDLYLLPIRGFNYGAEWANNIDIGKIDNHQGFNARAQEVFEYATSFMNYFSSGKNIKLWITGYSRGGAVANVLADMLLKHNKISQENLFVYTFEAPRCIDVNNTVKYDNIFNLVNSNDLIARIPPQEYDLKRCGIDVVINTADKNLDELILTLDSDFEFPAFTPYEGLFETETEFANYLITQLLADTGDENTNMRNRSEFCDNYAEHVGYAMALYFTMNKSTVEKIKAALAALDTWGMIGLLGDNDEFYNFVKPILDEDEVSYDDNKLKAGCATLVNLLKAKPAITLLLASTDYKNDISRLIYLHSPETVYVLIK